ncbi:MAG: hypothetical protein IPH35_18740 [Rhodoferax sp.]|nr:hypothetical protein [Rhodoferax sp.]
MRAIYTAGVLAQACFRFLRQKDPEKAGPYYRAHGAVYGVNLKGFHRPTGRPRSCLGFSDTALTIESPSFKSANEW